MLFRNELTNEVYPAFRKVLGSIFLIIGVALAFSVWLTSEIVALILSCVAGLPLGLVGFSILCGKARRGHGIFSPFTLYAIGIVIAVASVVGMYYGHPKIGVGVVLASSCIALARTRSDQRDSW